MKKLALWFSVISLCALHSTAITSSHSDTYTIDKSKSKVEWEGRKMTGKHQGLIDIQSGAISNTHGKITGNLVLDMSSITVTDLEGKGKDKLENHLKSEDFFSVDEHPNSSYLIKSITPMASSSPGEPNYNVTGDLTIKGITHEITFPANIQFSGNIMTADGEAVVDRSKFDVKYRSPSFFEDLGDKMIHDEFTIRFNLTANK